MLEILRPAVKGLLTFIPGVQRILPAGNGGCTASAQYCYGVWLKHLTLLWENGLRSMPQSLAELGPGDCVGVGLAALLSGVDNYYALDVARHSSLETNLEVFDELVSLFQSRAARPTKGWPDFDPYLDADLFPNRILTDRILRQSLSAQRVAAIRHALTNPKHRNDKVSIKYIPSWADAGIIEDGSIDVILSHSVLEHVEELDSTYRAFYAWLKPKGRMTHQIDFSAHGLSKEWNGYRAYPEIVWKMILGKRTYLINRQLHSTHLALMKKHGFRLTCDLVHRRSDGIQRSDLSACWRNVSDDDLSCYGAFVQAEKDGAA